jgi:hypothetical protein
VGHRWIARYGGPAQLDSVSADAAEVAFRAVRSLIGFVAGAVLLVVHVYRVEDPDNEEENIPHRPGPRSKQA